MGAFFSFLKRKIQQKKAKRNLIRKNINQLREYGMALDRELELATRHVQELLEKDIPGSSISFGSLSNQLDNISLCSVRNVDSGVNIAFSLKDTGETKAVAADDMMVFADARCKILDENIRLLDDRKNEIEQDIQKSCARLKCIQTKAESFRFRHFVSKNPIDSWSVMSTPF